MAELEQDRALSWYAAREPVVILLLAGIALAFFFAVTALSRIYQQQEKSRGYEWSEQGMADLKAGQARRAVNDFHVALSYSRENYGYQLSLAQALMATGRKEDQQEAHTYLLNLWQREPENGTVNLALARLFAEEGDVIQSLRYYHNAIYAVWGNAPDAQRRAARMELINLLLRHQAQAQAEAELIALAGDLPENAPLHIRVGDLFMQASDYDRALEQYRQALKLEHHNAAALAGAGRAAFESGRYSLAEAYLQNAVLINSSDSQSSNLLTTTRYVLAMDPYRMRLSEPKRGHAVVDAFETAGERLQTCLGSLGDASNPSLQQLKVRWQKLGPLPRAAVLREHPDMIDNIMKLAFEIERQTSNVCGAPAGKDLALLLIAEEYEGN